MQRSIAPKQSSRVAKVLREVADVFVMLRLMVRAEKIERNERKAYKNLPEFRTGVSASGQGVTDLRLNRI